jgi:2-polyprenyl-3-methyl-5-hydroxy-6-metoxy-1,4-benzoquinol methylase
MIDLARAINGIRKVAAGLRPFSESVWPGVRNDLFVAHESIYRYFGGRVRGLDVLDAGCGTGYGSRILAESGARHVIGIDLDRQNVRYARKHYGSGEVEFEVADMERLSFGEGSFDAAIATNSVEHLREPAAFFDSLSRMLRADGLALVAVPPIYTGADSTEHSAIHYHRTNLTVAQWTQRLEATPFEVSFVLHGTCAGVSPDFRSRAPSRLIASQFEFHEVGRAEFLTTLSITAMFVLKRQ